ncbi:MAG: hypothetical protein M9932_01745 [Xanthobacteraceae bacterium]|nr:hypothetical protein [Xanthobacteraceae bacterium]
MADSESTTHTSAKPDPANIFLSLEDDIFAIRQYVTMLENIAAAGVFGNDVSPGFHRLTLTMLDHAQAIERGFHQAFESERVAA